MRRGFARIAAVVVIAAVPGHLASAQTADVEPALRRQLTVFLAAASHTPASDADKRTFDAFFADDVIYTRSTGAVIGKTDIMKSLDDPPAPGAPQSTYGAEDVSVRIHGTVAIVAFRLVQKLRDGTTNRYRNTATFMNRGGRWQVIAWQAGRLPD